MSEQITVRLDDVLHAGVTRAATADGARTVSDWVRDALARQVALSTALRARAEEDAHPPLYTPEQDDALHAARARRALAAFDDPNFDGPAFDATGTAGR